MSFGLIHQGVDMQLNLFNATHKVLTVKHGKTLEAELIYYFSDISTLIQKGFCVFDYRVIKYYRAREHTSSMMQIKINSQWFNIMLLESIYFNSEGLVVNNKHMPLFNALIKG